jgi:hypothetical protein
MNIWRGGIVVKSKVILSTVVSVGKELSELGSGSKSIMVIGRSLGIP